MEADMAVADLHESKAVLLHFRGGGITDKAERARNAAAQTPNDAGAGPSHAFQQAAAVQRRRARGIFIITIGHPSLLIGVVGDALQTGLVPGLFPTLIELGTRDPNRWSAHHTT